MNNAGIPESWVTISFPEAITRFQTRGGKLKTSDYLKSGCLPIVDQGQMEVVAYTDKAENKFQGPYPVIVFGDHTRNVKLLDFEFSVGADGVVLLRPKDERSLDIRFLYYWLNYVPLHNLGYSRHFKLLKDKFISFPETIDEQRRIVARIEELTRRSEEVRHLSLAREKELDVLLQSAYNRMIDGAEWNPLSQVASLVRRGISVRPEEKYEEMGIRSFGKGTFQKPILTGKEIGNKRIYWFHEGDLVFNNVFAWEGAIAVAQEEDQDRVGSHRFITYVPHEGVSTSEFLCHHFLSERGIEDIRAASPGSAGRNRTLGLEKLEQINVPVPDYQEQKRFAEMARRRRAIRRECATIEKEFKIFQSALLAKAFRGEL